MIHSSENKIHRTLIKALKQSDKTSYIVYYAFTGTAVAALASGAFYYNAYHHR
jgi:hypothetical protein